MVPEVAAPPSPARTTPNRWEQIAGDRTPPSVPSHCLCQPVPPPTAPQSQAVLGGSWGEQGTERLCWRLLP